MKFPEPASVAAGPRWLAAIGDQTLGLLHAGRMQYSVLRRAVHFIIHGAPQPGAVLQHMYRIGYQSVVFLVVVMGFIGMIVVYQAGVQMMRVVPDPTQLGAAYLQLLIKDLAASISALMLATRVGAGIAAEIGSMVVTEQVDALRMCAADPVDVLIRPRLIASMVMTVMLVIVAAFVAYLTGMWTAASFFDISPQTFTNLSRVSAGDLIVGLAKCVAYGAAIPIVSGYSGLSTFGGSEGVGTATTRAVVNSSLAVIILNFLISGAGYYAFE